ncbi:uncharacterized protein [Typha latifolia]|uniref:uncharacterized protein n=1 Tax=Typha latifolia TaxID=4733 RepID=UPI003C2EFF03
MWLAYLLADWVATSTLGILSNNRNSTSYGLANRDLHAFWAPFLLLHLSSPETITAFSLEDNELWRRHLLGLVFQVTMAIYVFVGSWSSTKLLVPANSIFLAGIIKYAEKTWALWHESEGVLKKSMVTNPNLMHTCFEIVKELCVTRCNKETSTAELERERERKRAAEREMQHVSRSELLSIADDFFHIAKRLTMGLILDFKDRQLSQPFFCAAPLMLSRGMDTLEKMDMKEKAVVDSVNNVEFDQSILLWHIASDICCRCIVKDPNNRTPTQKISNALSNYMLYLLIVRHSMLTTMMGQVLYEGTYKEVKSLLENFMCIPRNETMWERLLNIEGRKSTLFDAVTLAKELLKLEEDKRWKLMSGVWVEMLCFAATHCREYIHAKQLSDGGELLTFIWLLMTHLGLGDLYKIGQRWKIYEQGLTMEIYS